MLDFRRYMKLGCLIVAAFFGVFRDSIPDDLVWWVSSSMGGIIAACTAIIGFLDKGVANFEKEQNGEGDTLKTVSDELMINTLLTKGFKMSEIDLIRAGAMPETDAVQGPDSPTPPGA